MSYLASVAYKNRFTYSRVISTLQNLNSSELFFTPAINSSYYLPLHYFVRYISGTISSGLTIDMGTNPSAYNNIGSVAMPTVLGNIVKENASELLVAPGTGIYIKNANALSNSTNIVFEVILHGMYFTAY
jgi:hypothetical protein